MMKFEVQQAAAIIK